jgi:hypothetical protein
MEDKHTAPWCRRFQFGAKLCLRRQVGKQHDLLSAKTYSQRFNNKKFPVML